MITVPTPDYIGFLVTRKFPELREPPSPLAKKYGCNDGIYEDAEPPSPVTDAILKKAEKYRQELEKLPQKKIKEFYRDEFEKKNREDDGRRFFNQKSAVANFEHWSRMPIWSLDEAIALSFGKAPEVVFLGRMKSIMSYLSPFVAEYQNLHEVAARAVAVNQLTEPVKPHVFIQWAEASGIAFPADLKEKVASRGQDVTDWKNLYGGLSEKNKATIAEQQARIEALTEELAKAQADKPLKTRERDTAYKIILGMAIGGYRYDPKARKNPAVPDIAGDIERLGLSVDQDTIRRWLQEATEILPQEPDKT